MQITEPTLINLILRHQEIGVLKLTELKQHKETLTLLVNIKDTKKQELLTKV
tara:strand:+ start:704 stop:859 length:156 start_codon:yes stop_codon:yes gene_type:complete